MLRAPIDRFVLSVLLASGLTACGGGGSNTSPPPSPTGAGSTAITGMAVAGAVDGTLSVRSAAGNVLATTAVSGGAFSVSLPDSALSGELEFIVTGHYADEASGAVVNLTAANPLALRTAAGHFQSGQPGNAPVTPDSTVIRALVAERGMTLAQARGAFEAAFGYLPDTAAVPFDPAASDSAAISLRPQADKDAAFRAGMFSQLASDLGLSGDDIAGLPGALAHDLSDGDLDGEDGAGNAVTVGGTDLRQLHRDGALAFRVLKAHAGFVGSAANRATLGAPSAGLPSVPYDAPGAQKTVTTKTGRHITVTLDTVADAPFQTGFWTARVRHRVTMADADTLQPVDISSDPDIVGVSNHPMMYMLSGHDHTTPHGHDPETSGKAQGRYVLDNYYVMASAMGNGTPMGVWDYVLYIQEDTDGNRATAEETTEVIFHPQVRMTMGGDVLSVSASNAADQWTNMMGAAQARPYRIWLHEVVANDAGGHDLSVYVTTQNIANAAPGSDPHAHNLSFPAVRAGRVLQGVADATTGVRPDVTLDTVSVEVSLDGAGWQAMTAEGTTGRYRIDQLAGLSTSASNAVQLRLAVNGKVMTTAAGGMPQLRFTAP